MVIFRTFTIYLAFAGIVLALALIQKLNTSNPEAIYRQPAANPYDETVAAHGIIEAIGKNIEIGVPQSSLVRDVYVKVGDKVTQGQPLFRMDDRELHAQFLVQNALIAVAKAHVTRLKDQLTRLESVSDPRAISQEELRMRHHDVVVSQAELDAAEAQLTHTILLIERLTVCAPQEGAILQSNIRKGEFVLAGVSSPAMILGNIERMQIRVDIDEQNAARIAPHSPAVAYPKNNTALGISLRFEYIEPYVIPKRSLTGASDERVDTRVLQVIYTFDRDPDLPLYVGQQVDVFIKEPGFESLADLQESPADEF